ncbi:MAG: hypothetical protein IPG45_04485 [Deltaproteobacteria bacterium]|nr:hypothetical protein [Deltaproteobacteria bacterium]
MSWWTVPEGAEFGAEGVNSVESQDPRDRAYYLMFGAGLTFCAREFRVVETTYGKTDHENSGSGTLMLLVGPSKGTAVSLKSKGPTFTPGTVTGVARMLCAFDTAGQACGGVVAPSSSIPLSTSEPWAVDGRCFAEVTPTGLTFRGDAAVANIDCVVSSRAAVVIRRSNFAGPVRYSVDGQAQVALTEDAFQIPGGSKLRLEADVGGQPVSWSCTGNAGSRFLANEETLTIESVRSDLTCTVGTACEAPTVTLEATAEDGSPLVDLDTTTTNVIDLEPTTSVLFKVSGDGFEPTSMVTLLVNGGAIDEFVGEKTIVMQEILSSDAAYDLQAEVQACGAAVRSPAIQLRRM